MNFIPNPGLPGHKSLSKIIGEMAVIASVQVSSLGMTRLDKEASLQSDIAHHAKEGTGRNQVCRLPGAEKIVAALKAFHAQARAVVKANTSKWKNDRYLLMNTRIGEVAGEIHDITIEHDKLRDEFVNDAVIYINAARHNLGTYNVVPPTQSEIENAFSLKLELEAVPDISSYSAADSAIEQQLKAMFERDMEAAYVGAQRDLMARLVKPLENLAIRMAAYDERERLQDKGFDTGKTGTFKSTVLTNVTDIGELIKGLNVTNDPALAAIVAKLDAFNGLEHKDLTAHADLRADTAKRAADIKASLSAWL